LDYRPENNISLPEGLEAQKGLAVEFLESDAFKIAEQSYTRQLINGWINSSPDQEEERERIWYMLKSFQTMKLEVTKILHNAETNITRLETKRGFDKINRESA